jgi:hypothetical protein
MRFVWLAFRRKIMRILVVTVREFAFVNRRSPGSNPGSGSTSPEGAERRALLVDLRSSTRGGYAVRAVKAS